MDDEPQPTESGVQDTAAQTAAPSALRRSLRHCGPSDPMLQLVYSELDRQFEALQLALAEVDTEASTDAVHRARNATRRLRVALKVFRELLPADMPRRLAKGLSWLADALGRVRDLDVHRGVIDRCLARLPVSAAPGATPYVRSVDAEHTIARRALLEVLTGERVARLSADFSAFLDREPSQAALRRSLGFTAREGAALYAERGVRKLRRTGRKVDRHSPPEQLHRLRIRCKRVRYKLESFEPVCGDSLRPALKLLRRLQDTLGAHHDAAVASERLDRYLASIGMSEDMTDTRQALREMIRLQREDADAALRRFERDWQRFEDRVLPRRLRHKLEEAG